MNYSLTTPITKNYILAFLIGFASSYPSLMPTALSLIKNKGSGDNSQCNLYKIADFETKFMYIPIIYGILSVVIFLVINNFFPGWLNNYWTVGFIIALIYPSIGYFSQHAQKVYGIKSAPKLYLGAQAMYLTFYGLIINYLINNI